MEEGFKRGDRVFVRDYPFGNPTNVSGVIVGILKKDIYNVRLESGLNEGNIISVKYWKLLKLSEISENTCNTEEKVVILKNEQ
jgi:signal peptidase I